MSYRVKDIRLAEKGKLLIEWAEAHMPVLMKIRERFAKEKPLRGWMLGCCLHVTKETAVLVRTLMAGGAEVYLAGSNPLSTQDEVAAALAVEGAKVYAWRGETVEEYYACINEVVGAKPQITMDDGADLTFKVHEEKVEGVKGGTEETTTGVIRLRAMAEAGALKYPIIAVNDAYTKYLFDNRYGTGQSTIDGVLRATNILFAGKTVVVAGYGWCGRGIAMRARGMGSNVIVTEVDPLRALEAVMDGYRVMSMKEAARLGDVFITATGDINVIRGEHLALMKNGAILANSGHFNVEICIPDLESMAVEKRKLRDNLDEYKLRDGRKLYLLAEGRLVNLAAAEGHPSEVMDMSFSNQALCAEYLAKNGPMPPKVYKVPDEVDRLVAKMKLEAMGIEIDELTEEQRKYLSSWETGT